MANVDTSEEFWGITLSGKQKVQSWTPSEDEEDIGHKIQLTQACLGQKAKEGERNVIEVVTENDDGEKISCSIVSLRVGFVECMHLELGFTNPVKFTLKEGNGPISLCGVHLSSMPMDLDSDMDDMESDSDDEDVPQLVEATATIEELPAEPAKEKIVTVEKAVEEPKEAVPVVAAPVVEEKKEVPVPEEKAAAKKRPAPKEEKEVNAKKKKEEPEKTEEAEEGDDEDEYDDDDEDDEDDEDMEGIDIGDLLGGDMGSDDEMDSDEDEDGEDNDEDDEEEEEEEEEETPKPKKKPAAKKVNGAAPKKEEKAAATPKPTPKGKTAANKENATPKPTKPTKEATKKDTTTPKKNPEELRAFLLKSPNLPKKYEKFANFLKNNMKVTESKTQKELWEFVQKNKK